MKVNLAAYIQKVYFYVISGHDLIAVGTIKSNWYLNGDIWAYIESFVTRFKGSGHSRPFSAHTQPYDWVINSCKIDVFLKVV